MKRFFIAFVSLALVTMFLSVMCFAQTTPFEDDYVSEGDFVLASFHNVKPYIADAANPSPLEGASFWLTDIADDYNLKYVSFIGDMSSGANYTWHNWKVPNNKSTDDLLNMNKNDQEWKEDFLLLKSISGILTREKIPCGVSINLKDYYSDGFDRANHMQTCFEMTDFSKEADVEIESYDINNYATIINVNKVKYIIYQLELCPRTPIIEWFNTIQAKHADKYAIVYTTSFLTATGEMYTQHDWSDPNWRNIYSKYNSKMRTQMMFQRNPHDGDQLWKDVFEPYDNILCVVSANASTGKLVTNTFKNSNGVEVGAVVADLSTQYAKENLACPVLLKISADNKTLDVRYAVPYEGYVTDSKTIIELDKIGDIEEPDPVEYLPKVKAQPNGANTAYINGYEGNLFKPNANMTKAEACAIFARILLDTQDIPSGYTTRFTDVTEDDWFYNAIAYLDESGFFFTNTSDKYNPNDMITRAEFAELAYFASDLGATGNLTFSDVDKSNKYYDAIMSAAAAGLVNGYGDGTFRPNATITRAEVVTVINRLVSLLVTDETVTKEKLSTVFSDIDGHWAENQILMASNSNVHTDFYYATDLSDITETAAAIEFQTDYVKVSILKNGGRVSSIVSLDTGKNIVANSTTPWFAYLKNEIGTIIQPKRVDLVDGRVKVTFANGFEAYFLIDTNETYFSVTLDTQLPSNVYSLSYGVLNGDYYWKLDSDDAYALSCVAMTTNVNPNSYPGGETKSVYGTIYHTSFYNTVGAKLGIVFSKFNEHRELLKVISADIDPKKGVTSTQGGPFTYDHEDNFYDYGLLTGGLTPETAEKTADTALKYSLEQIDMHQGAYTFIQGNFSFACAATPEEKKKGHSIVIPASAFKERIADIVTAKGVQLALHTYSSLVSNYAYSIISDPQWQQYLAFADTTYTLRGDLTKFRKNIKTNEDASGFQCVSDSLPYGTAYTRFILIDEEIIRVKSGTTSGFINVERGLYGTKPAEHKDGAVIRQLLGFYANFQPEPLSPLFYNIAERTAKAYNEGGFEMIYLDGFESFARKPFIEDSNLNYYIYAEFLRTVLSNCETDPIIEYSIMYPALWAARGRNGAIDHARRSYKEQKRFHINRQVKALNYFYTATLGWYNYDPDMGAKYKDVYVHTIHRDDLDFKGSYAVAYNFSTVCQPFSISEFDEPNRLSDNFLYYSLYSRLREGGYFAPEVKQQIIDGKYEYKVFKKDDGTWAFKEMSYVSHKVFDPKDYSGTGIVNNPFSAQTPYIRIEQKYSTLFENEKLLIAFDETKPITALKGNHSTGAILDFSDNFAYKVRLHGNGSDTDAVLLVLTDTGGGTNHLLIPLNFTGWKEVIVVESVNDDYGKYTFDEYPPNLNDADFRNTISPSNVNQVRIALCGACDGVYIDDIYGYTPTDAPVANSSVTIGKNTITFDAEVHSGDFIEYYPEDNKAYLYYYTNVYDEKGTWTHSEAHVKEISFTGSVQAPAGDFTFSYSADATTAATPRAHVVFGFSGAVIENPEDWVAPEIEMPEDIEKVRLY